MKISECSYCGKMALIENEACYDCAKAIGLTTEPDKPERIYPAEMPNNNSQQNYNPQQSYTSQNAGNEYEPQLKYTEVSCWRCKEISIWEQTKICLKCGCALKLYNNEELVTLQGESILNSPGIRSMLIIIFLLVAGVSGIFYLSKSPNEKKAVNSFNHADLYAPVTAKAEEVKLPPDSWYKPSIWNFYREKPTVDEVLKKNIEATSKLLKTGDFETLSLSGILSATNAGCASDKCAEIEKKMAQSNPRVLRDDKNTTLDSYKVGLVDYFEGLDYKPLGTLESAVKSPNKIFRKVSVTAPGQTKTTEKTEGYDGATGWRKTVVTERGQTLENSVTDLPEIDLYELKNSASAWGKNYSSKSLSLVEMKNIKGKVQFVLWKNDTGKGEYIYFDAVSGLVTQIKNDDMTCFLSSYTDNDGYKMPSVIYFRSINPDGNAVILKIENIVWNINKSVEDTIFAKPN